MEVEYRCLAFPNSQTHHSRPPILPDWPSAESSSRWASGSASPKQASDPGLSLGWMAGGLEGLLAMNGERSQTPLGPKLGGIPVITPKFSESEQFRNRTQCILEFLCQGSFSSNQDK